MTISCPLRLYSRSLVGLSQPAGGLIQGDRARMQFTFAPRSQVHLTTQAAEKIHAMTANLCGATALVFP
ncbi:MAG: urease accessory protein UreD [Candidatus Binatia bacterium]